MFNCSMSVVCTVPPLCPPSSARKRTCRAAHQTGPSPIDGLPLPYEGPAWEMCGGSAQLWSHLHFHPIPRPDHQPLCNAHRVCNRPTLLIPLYMYRQQVSFAWYHHQFLSECCRQTPLGMVCWFGPLFVSLPPTWIGLSFKKKVAKRVWGKWSNPAQSSSQPAPISLCRVCSNAASSILSFLIAMQYSIQRVG